MNRLETEFCGVTLAAPVLTASGCSNYGHELADFGDLARIGGVVGKTITPLERRGNPMPRIAETPSGMINAIGLENVGRERFLAEIADDFVSLPCATVVNIAGFSVEEYGQMAEAVTGRGFSWIEVNGSCPNVESGGSVFCADPDMTRRVTETVKTLCSEPVVMKLSPNVADIASIARAAVEGGADGLSLINTLVGTTVDWRRRRRGTAFGTGGLSGPAIKPVALRAVDQVCAAVDVPVCAIGGISTAEDVCEFLALGATCCQVGTALFANPACLFEMIDQLTACLDEGGYATVGDVRGVMRT